jgi:long-chain acyl-CoA synthetase
MHAINIVTERMSLYGLKTAIVWKESSLSYSAFVGLVDEWSETLSSLNIGRGSVCGYISEYSPQTCALIFALIKAKAILVPFSKSAHNELPEFLKIACVDYLFRFESDDSWAYERIQNVGNNELLLSFIERDVPGLIVFSSGSTGKPKAILQDCERVMRKFIEERQGWNTLLFLMIDHFGGFNTLMSTFAYGGTAICLPDRSPDSVCRVIEKTRASLLPTTPTFINMLIASRAYKNFDLSSINMITYGTEVMPPATLNSIHKVFPNARLKQTYGLSELGVLRSKSERDDSVWLKIGGDGFETKIIDNILWVRSEANMVGYLNAPNPIDKDGWMCTGDHVEIRGEYIHILGRKSDMINVGGQKVFPAEIENILLQAGNITEATVIGVPHPIMGHVVRAMVSLISPEEPFALTERLRKHCISNMSKYKIPIKFTEISSDEHRNMRFKKIRSSNVDLI